MNFQKLGTVAAIIIGQILVLAALTGIVTTPRRIVFVDTLSINNVMPPFVYEGDHRRFYGLTLMPMCPRKDEQIDQPPAAGERCNQQPSGLDIVLHRGLRSGRGSAAVKPEYLAQGLKTMLKGYEAKNKGNTLEVRRSSQGSEESSSVPVPLLEPWLQLQASAVVLKEDEGSSASGQPDRGKKKPHAPEGTGPFYVESLCSREEREGFECSSPGPPQPEQFDGLAGWLDDVLVLKRRQWSIGGTNEIVFLGLGTAFSKEEKPTSTGVEALVHALNNSVVHAVFDVEDDLRRRLLEESSRNSGRPEGWRFTNPRQDSVLVAALQPEGSKTAATQLPERCRERLIDALAQVRKNPIFLRHINAQPADQLLPESFESVHKWKHEEKTSNTYEGNCSIRLLTNSSWNSAANRLKQMVAEIDPSLEIIADVKKPEDESSARSKGEYGISLLALVFRPHPPAFFLWDNLRGSRWAKQEHMEELEELARDEAEAKAADEKARDDVLARLDVLHQQLDKYLIPMAAPTRVAAVNNRLLGLDPGQTLLRPDQLRLAPSTAQTTARFMLLAAGLLFIAVPVYFHLTRRAAAREVRIQLSLRMFRHDILAPLATIKARAERVSRLDEQAGNALLSEAEAALAIAEDARFYVQKGKTQTEDTAPSNLLDEVIEPILGTLRRRALYEKVASPMFTVDLPDQIPPLALPADVARFVVRVLIENSWRHRGEHPLRLELIGTVSGKRYCLEVRDWGPGIAEEDIKQLFRPGHPSNGTRKQAREGSGMGLHLARSVLRFHGGTVELRSASNPTAFKVCFPVAPKRDHGSETNPVKTERP